MIPEQIRNLIPSRTKRAASAAFTTTHWSVVLTAQHESPAAEAALEKLCRGYWRPIYSFLRRQGAGREDAEDLTQAFFALLLERRGFDAVRQEKGRLRCYLLASLKHFLANERRRATRAKRGKGQRAIPLEELRANQWTDVALASPLLGITVPTAPNLLVSICPWSCANFPRNLKPELLQYHSETRPTLVFHH
jgi:hypothetical protein